MKPWKEKGVNVEWAAGRSVTDSYVIVSFFHFWILDYEQSFLFSEVRRASSKKVRGPESHVAHYPAPFVFLLIFLDSRDGLRFKGRNAPRSPSGF